MNIDKSKLKSGLWFTDGDGNYIPLKNDEIPEHGNLPSDAVYAHSCFPLEITENIYKIRDDGGYGEKDRIVSFHTNIGRSNGRLIVAMVNSGDYDLYDAVTVVGSSCERCLNVLWYTYMHEEDGYAEFSNEWYAANTECDFCRELGKDTEDDA